MHSEENNRGRRLHRILATILALPLAWQAVTGYILYYRFDPEGKARPWKEMLVKLHNGEFLGDFIYIIGLFYVILILVFIVNGVIQIRNKKIDHNRC